MGYKKTEILQEYKKYEMISEYHTIYVKGSEAKRDSLAKAYPDNLLGSIEGMWHYFTSPSKYLTKFENSLTNYADPQFSLDYLVIYKPTFKGDTSYILGEKKVENESFIVYSLNKNL
jgi:hypothetical protein